MSEEGTSGWQDVAVDPNTAPEWYVALGDNQVGPITLADVHRHIGAGEVDAEPMAWKTGMPDWLPVSDIPELSTLLPASPVSSGSAGGDLLRAPMISATPAAPAATPSFGSSGPVTFGGDAGGAAGNIDWKPSAASALSALVQDEIVQKKEEEAAQSRAASAPAGMPSLGAPGLGGVDLFTPGSAGFAAPAPAASPAAGWSVPSAPPRKEGAPGWVWLVVGLVLFLLVAIVLVVVLIVPRLQPERQPMAMAPPPIAQPAAPTVGAPSPGAPQPSAAAPEPTAADDERAGGRKGKGKGKGKDGERDGERGGAQSKDKGGGGGKSGMDDLFADEGGGKKGGAGKVDKPKLEKGDIIGGVKSNATALMPCLQKARQKGEMAPGTYTIPLEFMVNANGSVSGGKMGGPANLMGTSLPGCFAGAMRGWKFPSTNAPTPVKGFPFGPFTVK